MLHQFQWSHQLESNLLVFQFHDGVRWHILDDELLEAFLAPFLGVEKFLGGEPRRFFDGDLGGRIRRVVSGSRAWCYRKRSCCCGADEQVEACVVKDDESMSGGASTQSGGDGLGCGDQAFAELDVIVGGVRFIFDGSGFVAGDDCVVRRRARYGCVGRHCCCADFAYSCCLCFKFN